MKKFSFLLIISLFLSIVACSVKSADSQHPNKYVGIYDGNDGTYIELKSNGTGTYKEKGKKSSNLSWFVDNYTLSVSADALKFEIHADLHNFDISDSLFFQSNALGWNLEKFKKRK